RKVRGRGRAHGPHAVRRGGSVMPPLVPLAPLVARSHFSLLRGVTPVEDLCRAARARGYTRLALTDRDNLYGLPAFLKACRYVDLQPIIGAEITDPAPGSTRRAICLVRDEEGYRNLCRLITARHGEGFSLTEAVRAHAQGLIVL